MGDRLNQVPRLTPGLRAFLAESAQDDAAPASGSQSLAEIYFEVEEKLLGSTSLRVRQGGVRLNRVTYYLLGPDDLPAIFDRRPDIGDIRLVLAQFWLMFRELQPKYQYTAIRIRIKLDTPAPVLTLSPDRSDVSVSPAFATLLNSADQAIATAIDEGADGFGWTYQASGDAPLWPQRHMPYAILELPLTATALTGQFEAEAEISRSFVGDVIVMKAEPVQSAVPFSVSLGARPGTGQSAAERDDAGQPVAGPAPDPAQRDRLAPARQGGSRPASYDLGLIIPLRVEFDCAREILPFERRIKEDGLFVYPFGIPGSSLRGVAVVLYGMGPTVAGVTAANLLDRYEFPLLGLVGIAGALDGDLRLGDVLVASSVDEYLNGAKARPDATGEGFEFDTGPNVWRAGRDLVSYVRNFRYSGDQGDFGQWQSRAKQRGEAGGLGGASPLARSEPDYLVGAIASGPVVSAATGFSRWLRQRNRHYAAIEMEGSGVAEAIYQHGGTDMLIVRGISDFADERKQQLDATPATRAGDGAWRRYAALNAVDLLAALVRGRDFPWSPAAR